MAKGLSISYVARNLATRKLTTLLTAAGMALVVFVFACVLMMSEGLRETLAGTGSYHNVILIRKGSQTEIQSTISREQATLIATLPGVATDSRGEPALSSEALVLINLPRNDGKGLANVVVRGTSDRGLALRPQVKLHSGRFFKPGSSEIMIGQSLTRGKLGLRVGDTLTFGLRQWRIVGTFEAGASGFDSEIWGDVDQIMQAFRRNAYSSTVLRLREDSAFDALKKAIDGEPRLTVDYRRESLFYADQSEKMSSFITILGNTITMIFSIGAIIGAMITMYSSVANRTREIGTLRALGFQRRNILGVFLQESMLLGFISGAVGLVAACGMQWVEISTTNIQTFSEVVFKLIMTPGIAINVMLFSLFMGVLGGVLPAAQAARMEIVDALRSS